MIKKSQPPVTKTIKSVATATPVPMAAKGLEKSVAPKKQQPAKVAPVKPKSALVATGGTKIQTVVDMLHAKQGASLEQLSIPCPFSKPHPRIAMMQSAELGS